MHASVPSMRAGLFVVLASCAGSIGVVHRPARDAPFDVRREWYRQHALTGWRVHWRRHAGYPVFGQDGGAAPDYAALSPDTATSRALARESSERDHAYAWMAAGGTTLVAGLAELPASQTWRGHDDAFVSAFPIVIGAAIVFLIFTSHAMDRADGELDVARQHYNDDLADALGLCLYHSEDVDDVIEDCRR